MSGCFLREFNLEPTGTEFCRVALPCLSAFYSLHSVLFFPSSGPEWSRLRRVLNPKMLKLHEVSIFATVINEVVDDLLKRLELLRRRSEDGSTVPDVASEFYKFGFEGEWSVRAQFGPSLVFLTFFFFFIHFRHLCDLV